MMTENLNKTIALVRVSTFIIILLTLSTNILLNYKDINEKRISIFRNFNRY